MIDLNFGTRTQKKFCSQKLLDEDRLFITKIILGEFKRTIFFTSIKIITKIFTEFDSISEHYDFREFLDEISIEIPTFSLHEKDRIMKIMNLLKKRLLSFYDIYKNQNIPFQFALNSILDDFIHFKSSFLLNITILNNSIDCFDAKNKMIYDIKKRCYQIEKYSRCKNCEVNKLEEIYNNYRIELEELEQKITSKELKLDSKFLEAFYILFKIKNIKKYDGRKHPCIRLTDLFVILEAPIDFFIFTTNYRHFLPLTQILKRTLL